MAGAGERRIVSVLLSDVVDSTGIAERLGPERSKFLFDEIAELMAADVRRFDGTVAQLTGDGVLALFGAPVAHGDDAERAVRAALGIHASLGRYAEDVASSYGTELAARVAVNTGPVVVPARSAAPDVLYNALGDTVNVAARLQSHAGPGGVVVGPATAREVAGRFELEPLGELALKGVSQAVEAFRVTGEREPEAASLTPLVGRETELARVVEALARLEDGVGSIIAITGEAGVGKSRLFTEARSRLGSDVRVLVGSASSYTTLSPFWPLRDLLRGWLGVGVSEPETRLRLELKTALAAALDRQADDVYPFLASLLGIAPDERDAERLRGFSRDSVQRQTFEAVGVLCEALARERPLCLVLEDLHWADESTLALVEELLALADREAAALVLLYRSERGHGSWHLGEVARQRYPHRLAEVEVRLLVDADSKLLASRAAGADLPGEVADLLAARSGGNPFFLEEALRDLIERDVLRPVNAHWELTVAADEITVPLLVQETLQARLDRLERPTREVANVASVIGRTFGLPLLEQLVDRGELLPALSELQRLDLVVEERRRPAPEYRFRHGLVPEVAYASLTEASRRALHLAAGEALEAIHSDSLEEAYEPLARHFSEAGATERAVTYLLAAGDAAWALYADRAALAHYERAVGLMADDDPGGRDLLFKIALARHVDFDFAGADAAWVEACARPIGSLPEGRATERFVVHFQSGDLIPGRGSTLADYWVGGGLFSGLLRLSADLNVVPDVAAELRVSDDGLCYRATLRDDALWSDGEPVKADDFVYGWAEIRRQELTTAYLLEDVAEATAVDERTLEIRLHRPRASFPYLLAMLPTFPWPKHRRERLPEAWYDLPRLVSNGAFTIADVDDDRALLVTNERWHGPRGNVGELVLRRVSIEEAAEIWPRGELDFMFFPPAQLIAEAPDPGQWLQTDLVGFVADLPPFDDVRVRRAFAHALDRTDWARRSGRHEPATSGGLLPPAMPGHSHRIGLDFDPVGARHLLAEAGYPSGRGLPEIQLVSPVAAWVEWVAEQWRETLDVKVSTGPLGFSEDPRDVAPRANSWVHGWTAEFPDPAGFVDVMLNASTGHPAALHRDDELEELLARATQTTNPDERLALYQELERRWLSDLVALVPLGYPRQFSVTRPWVDCFRSSPMMLGHISDIVIRR